MYSVGALILFMSLIFIPLGLQAFKFALFALQPIGKEPFNDFSDVNRDTNYAVNPLHPYSIAGNILWLVTVSLARIFKRRSAFPLLYFISFLEYYSLSL
jgi:uncharacterized membrane protein YccF (DUF307 family)